MKAASVLGVLLAAVVAVGLLVSTGCSGNDEVEPAGHIVLVGSHALLFPAAGGAPDRLEVDEEEVWDAALSYDGERVAFNPSPYVDARGFRIRNLESGETRVIAGQPPEDQFESYDLAWAPDARSLAFVNGDGVYVIGVDGTGLRRLGSGSSPTWTPDSKHLVFASGDNRGDKFEIAVIRAEGTGLRLLGDGSYPDVSPSGDEVAYSTQFGIFVRPLDGGDSRLVVPNGFGPVWSPDGEFIAFTRYTRCGGHGPCSGRFFVVPTGGGEVRPVGPLRGDPGPPDDWIP